MHSELWYWCWVSVLNGKTGFRSHVKTRQLSTVSFTCGHCFVSYWPLRNINFDTKEILMTLWSFNTLINKLSSAKNKALCQTSHISPCSIQPTDVCSQIWQAEGPVPVLELFNGQGLIWKVSLRFVDLFKLSSQFLSGLCVIYINAIFWGHFK